MEWERTMNLQEVYEADRGTIDSALTPQNINKDDN